MRWSNILERRRLPWSHVGHWGVVPCLGLLAAQFQVPMSRKHGPVSPTHTLLLATLLSSGRDVLSEDEGVLRKWPVFPGVGSCSVKLTCCVRMGSHWICLSLGFLFVKCGAYICSASPSNSTPALCQALLGTLCISKGLGGSEAQDGCSQKVTSSTSISFYYFFTIIPSSSLFYRQGN